MSKDDVILINQSGRGDKDIFTVADAFNDPKWEQYFEKRLDAKMVAQWRGRRSLLHLWRTQDGLCPICRGKITKETGWDNHHLIHR